MDGLVAKESRRWRWNRRALSGPEWWLRRTDDVGKGVVRIDMAVAVIVAVAVAARPSRLMARLIEHMCKCKCKCY